MGHGLKAFATHYTNSTSFRAIRGRVFSEFPLPQGLAQDRIQGGRRFHFFLEFLGTGGRPFGDVPVHAPLQLERERPVVLGLEDEVAGIAIDREAPGDDAGGLQFGGASPTVGLVTKACSPCDVDG